MKKEPELHALVRGALGEGSAPEGEALDVLTRLSAQLYARDAEVETLSARLDTMEATSADQLESVLRALSDGLFTLDAEGRCLTINKVASRYLGVPAQQLIGERVLGSFKLSANHENSPDVFFLLWTSIRVRLALRFEQAILLRPDGGTLDVSCVFNPLIENDEVVGCVFVFRDVSASRRAERELRQLNEALTLARDSAVDASRSKSTFLANMSHELRTPLNAIIGYSELVTEEAQDVPGAEMIAQDVSKIHSAAGHLLDIINDILDVSKIEAGKMEVFAETFDLYEFARAVATSVEQLVHRNGNTLEVQCARHIGTMHTDQMKLRQSLLNLLSNAAKFTDQGTISLRIWREFGPLGEQVHFEVEDSGIGIPEDRIEHLFDSFTQADQSTTRRFGGTGLGLTITYQFAHLMGGDVVVTSTQEVGSTFTLRIPALLVTSAGSTEEAALFQTLEEDTSLPSYGETPVVGASQRLILAVDDDPTAFELISRFLPASEFYVVHAKSGEEGLRLARELKPDLITLDVMMPGVDGWTVLSRLKADPELDHIPVIMLTITGERQRSFSLGATDYLTKPIQRSRLVDVLRRYASSAGLVMVVEDDEETRNIVHRVLEARGWRTLLARDGAEALELLERHTPDVMLLDLMMPRVDGFGVLDALRADPRFERLPVIVLTAMDLSVEELQMLNKHVSRVLQKGETSARDLASLVRSAIGNIP